jgi:cytochrome oxidase assembly protein ShyY1
VNPTPLTERTDTVASDAETEAPLGWSFLRSRRWLGYFAMLLIFTVVCVLLGNWQFQRRAEARAEISRIDQNYDAPAIPISEALPKSDSYDQDVNKWQTVEITGRYLDEFFLARNRPNQQQVGTNLISPFQTEDGTIFFVDRGWLAPGQDPQTPAAIPGTPKGLVTVQVRLRGSEPVIDGRETSGNLIASIDLPELERLIDRPSYTGGFGLLISENPETAHGVLPPRPLRDEGPHLSYALQWYVFIIIAAVGVAYAARQDYRGLNAGSEAVRLDDARLAERKRRRGPSDADEEDALLDG